MAANLNVPGSIQGAFFQSQVDSAVEMITWGNNGRLKLSASDITFFTPNGFTKADYPP